MRNPTKEWLFGRLALKQQLLDAESTGGIVVITVQAPARILVHTAKPKSVSL
jgi:hypothetical protein